MPYALFCDDAKLSRSYPTEADVWKLARDSGLVTDIETKAAQPTPRRVLDNDYEIRPCEAEPGECPEKNKVAAREEKDFQLELKSPKSEPNEDLSPLKRSA
ncbi:hypothetical protein [Rhodopseudomonas sp. P2A-2r]|uniref:hypothetical protein n=1 Tax=unclassified Rhodopseudomonas TaxID=2638247 RepID=UPI0022341F89|nr:hypothetical protein [Rhodopseudomonas sp. P2A-2r]UZE47673.1 hypothetical protein ONR75_22640 [Rhodopseudomonas sp. P2A-2r]